MRATGSGAAWSSSAAASPYAAVRALLVLRGPAEAPAAGPAVAAALARHNAGQTEAWWRGFVAEAAHHGVAPLLAPLLAAAAGAQPGCVPAAARRSFAIMVRSTRSITVAREACVEALLTGLDAACIPALLLKGAALAHLIYADPALRPMYDIDILVDAAQVQAARAVAERMGFVFATAPGSRFAGRHHHLPVATRSATGLDGTHPVRLELHSDTLSPDRGGGLTLGMLAAPPQTVPRGAGRPAQALGHHDMLLHLCAHAFEPARQVRLIHLYDIWRYRTRFHAELDGPALVQRHPATAVALEMACLAFAEPPPALPGIGFGMVPLAEIAATRRDVRATLAALFHPPAWWLRGFYGIPLGRSLLPCLMLQHPATVLRWLWRRAWALTGAPRLAGTPG